MFAAPDRPAAMVETINESTCALAFGSRKAPSGALRATSVFTAAGAAGGQVVELGQRLEEGQLGHAGGAIALLGDDDLGKQDRRAF